MSDIVKELLSRASDQDGIGWTPTTIIPVPARLLHHAADRIEQLEADQRDTTEEFGRLSHDLGNALLEIERLRAERDEQVRWVKDLADSLIEAEGKIGVKNARIEQLEAYALKAFTVVEFCAGEGLLIPHPHFDCDDLLMEGVDLLKVETSEEARAALEDKP